MSLNNYFNAKYPILSRKTFGLFVNCLFVLLLKRLL